MAPFGPLRAQTREAQDPLEVREQHLDFLSPATGLHIFRSCGVRTSHVAGVFVRSRGILRARAFGQHWALSLQMSQSNLLAR